MMRLYRMAKMMASNMRCVICGGWGGEWGDAQGGRSICKDCWDKGHR
jgi:hypothetical protein